MKYRTQKILLLILFILSVLGLCISFTYTEEGIGAGIFLITFIASFILLIIRNLEEETITSIIKSILKNFSTKLKEFVNRVKDWIKKYLGETIVIIGSGIFVYNLLSFSHRVPRFYIGFRAIEVQYYYTPQALLLMAIGVMMIITGILIIRKKKTNN